MVIIKVLSLFSGIGAFERALTNIGTSYELVGFSEIDKWAIESYSAIHGVSTDLNMGDVSEIAEEDLPDADMVTYGFPCSDISVAGLGKGIKEGTRSGLLYEAERIIDHVKPKYAIAENVKNLIGKRHRGDFDKLLIRLEGYGYNNYWKILNAKDFGIPQNRERVFIVSIRKDVDDGMFGFPEGFDSGLRLKDMLLDEVEEKYYIESDIANELLSELDDKGSLLLDVSQRRREGKSREYNDNAPTLAARDYKEPRLVNERGVGVPVVAASRGRYVNEKSGETQQQLELNEDGTTNTLTSVQKDNWVLEPNAINQLGLLNIKGNEQVRRVYGSDGISPTLNTMQGGNREPKVATDYRIRKLTPQETWRLMGFTDEDYWTARTRLEETFYNGGDRSNSQMYKQAGNSIVVDVLEHLFKNLLGGHYGE